jgi:anti-sigma regulatory factor (Ser/Thr protein kinase)
MDLRDDGPAQGKRNAHGDRSPHAGAVLLVLPSSDLRCHTEAPAPRITKWRFQATSPRCAHDSRLVLMSFLRQHAAADADLFTTELILGELLTNAVEHAPGRIDVRIDWAGDQPTLRVRDAGRGFTAPGSDLPKDLFDENGRGLFLVTTLAPDVHIGPIPGGFGTQITLRLPISRATRSPESPVARAA